MRAINKKEINILLTPHQHALVSRLRETGINLSSLSRLAIRKFSSAPLDDPDDGVKSKRVVIYLESDDIAALEAVSSRKNISKSEALRRLLSIYLTTNENALNQLF